MNEQLPSEKKLPFYDEQMQTIVEQALAYLNSERGQEAMRQAAARSAEFAAKLRASQNIPWEKLYEPFTI